MNFTRDHHITTNSPIVRRWTWSLMFVVALIGFFIKAPGTISNAQFWAEDGVIFFSSQFDSASPQIFTPYAGYLHAIPRLVAWFASFFPYALIPLVYNALTMLMEAWAIVYFATRATFIVPCWTCLAIILLAPGNGEVLGTLTNVQWFLQFAIFGMTLLPLHNIQKKPQRLLRIGTLAWLSAMSLTGPFSTLCLLVLLGSASIYYLSLLVTLPLNSIKDWWDHLDKPAVTITAIGGIIQLCVLLTVGKRTNAGRLSFEVVEKIFSEGVERHVLGLVPIPQVAFIGLVAVLIAFALYRAIRHRQEKWLSILLMLVFASMQILPLCYKGNEAVVRADTLGGDRYFFFMKISLYLAATLVLMDSPRTKRFKLYLAVPTALAALIATHPELGRRITLVDLHWKQSAAALEAGKFPVELPINPVPWKIILSAPRETDRH